MHRIPKPERMIDEKKARAYAMADFEELHSKFIHLFLEHFPHDPIIGYALDLGCGIADITRRFAQEFLYCEIDGIEGCGHLLKYGRMILKRHGLLNRVRLLQGYLPNIEWPSSRYDAIISNGFLHQLADPSLLWKSIKQLAHPHSPIFIMDFMRPESFIQAEIMVKQYVGKEREILRQDFYDALLAAYRIEEVEKQLRAEELEQLHIHEVSDRHFIVTGRLSPI